MLALAPNRRTSATAPDSRYRSVVETMSDGVVVQNADGSIELCNAHALELFGITEAELRESFAQHANWHAERLDGSPIPSEEFPINVTLRTGRPQRNVVLGVRRRDGASLWLMVNCSAIREHDRVTAVVCTFSDVTRRHVEEQARRASEERFRVVADGIGSVVFDHNLLTGELYRSETLESVFGWHDAEPTNQWWMARVHPDDVDRLASVMRPSFAANDGAPQWTAEYRFQHGDGSYVPVIERGVVLRNRDGAAYRCIGTVMDASDRAELTSQLRQAQKMEAVGQLAGGIAHDFNNLLTAITCNVELLLGAIAPNDARHEDVVQIRDAATRAAALTRQLLAFSRRQILQPRALDLNFSVESIERLLRRVISADVRLHTGLAPSLPPVFADSGQLEQVVMNLVLNARDAMPAGGTIAVRTSHVVLGTALEHRSGTIPAGDYAVLSVRDGGIGMAPGVFERLFEPFFTTKQHGKGTGLGLAIVQSIVLQSNGHVTVDSMPGCGTEFTVYLPALHSPKAAAAAQPAQEGSRAVGHTVLVVDDEPGVREVTMRALSRANYRVLGAASGTDALDVLARERDLSMVLLLTDIIMPEMNGHELAARVEARFPEARIASMSGFSPEEARRQGSATTSRELLHKPFTLPQLIAFVDGIFAADRSAA